MKAPSSPAPAPVVVAPTPAALDLTTAAAAAAATPAKKVVEKVDKVQDCNAQTCKEGKMCDGLGSVTYDSKVYFSYPPEKVSNERQLCDNDEKKLKLEIDVSVKQPLLNKLSAMQLKCESFEPIIKSLEGSDFFSKTNSELSKLLSSISKYITEMPSMSMKEINEANIRDLESKVKILEEETAAAAALADEFESKKEELIDRIAKQRDVITNSDIWIAMDTTNSEESKKISNSEESKKIYINQVNRIIDSRNPPKTIDDLLERSKKLDKIASSFTQYAERTRSEQEQTKIKKLEGAKAETTAKMQTIDTIIGKTRGLISTLPDSYDKSSLNARLDKSKELLVTQGTEFQACDTMDKLAVVNTSIESIKQQVTKLTDDVLQLSLQETANKLEKEQATAEQEKYAEPLNSEQIKELAQKGGGIVERLENKQFSSSLQTCVKLSQKMNVIFINFYPVLHEPSTGTSDRFKSLQAILISLSHDIPTKIGLSSSFFTDIKIILDNLTLVVKPDKSLDIVSIATTTFKIAGIINAVNSIMNTTKLSRLIGIIDEKINDIDELNRLSKGKLSTSFSTAKIRHNAIIDVSTRFKEDFRILKARLENIKAMLVDLYTEFNNNKVVKLYLKPVQHTPLLSQTLTPPKSDYTFNKLYESLNRMFHTFNSLDSPAGLFTSMNTLVKKLNEVASKELLEKEKLTIDDMYNTYEQESTKILLTDKVDAIQTLDLEYTTKIKKIDEDFEKKGIDTKAKYDALKLISDQKFREKETAEIEFKEAGKKRDAEWKEAKQKQQYNKYPPYLTAFKEEDEKEKILKLANQQYTEAHRNMNDAKAANDNVTQDYDDAKKSVDLTYRESKENIDTKYDQLIDEAKNAAKETMKDFADKMFSIFKLCEHYHTQGIFNMFTMTTSGEVNILIEDTFFNKNYTTLIRTYPGFIDLLKELYKTFYNIKKNTSTLLSFYHFDASDPEIKTSNIAAINALIELTPKLGEDMQKFNNVLILYTNAFITLSFQIATTLFGYGISILQIFMQNIPERLSYYTESSTSPEERLKNLTELNNLKEPIDPFVNAGDIENQVFSLSHYALEFAGFKETKFSLLLPLENLTEEQVPLFTLHYVASKIGGINMSRFEINVGGGSGGKKQRRLLPPPPSRPLQSNKRPKKRKTIKKRSSAANTTHKTTKKNKRYTNNKNNNKTKKNKQVKNILTKANQKRNKKHKRSIRKV